MSAWFLQIMKEGAAIAAFLVLAIYLPWPAAQLFLAVLLLAILWRLFRDPRFFYRRLAHMVLWVLLLPPLGNLSFQLLGYSTGEAVGIVRLAVELGASAPPALLAALVALFVAADILTVFLDGRRNRRRMTIEIQRSDIYAEPDGSYDARIELFVTAAAESPLSLGGRGRYRASLWSGWTDADVYPPAGDQPAQVPLADDQTIALSPNQSIKLYLTGDKQSRAGRWLGWWSRRWTWLAASYGAVRLSAATGSEDREAPVTFRLRASSPATPARAATAGKP